MNRSDAGWPGVVGLVSPGEMGVALGRVLQANGTRVVTTTENRSLRTAKEAEDSGLTVAPTLKDVLDEADLIVSLVPPGAAEEVAERLLGRWPGRRKLLYVDANSTSPQVARRIAAAAERAGVGFADVTIRGLALRLAHSGHIYLSGPAATEVAALFEPVLPITNLGVESGKASMYKQLMSGLTKGVAALVTEMSLCALDEGLESEFWADSRGYYPDVMRALETVLPSYGRHATRRAEEMAELADTLDARGVRHHFPRAAEAVIRRMAAAASSGPESDEGLEAFIRGLASREELAVVGADSDEVPRP